MGNTYKPDTWLIIKMPDNQPHKVLGGWSAGYLDGDSWRFNSGIIGVIIEEDYYLFRGHSGSIYKCHKDMERNSMATMGVLSQLLEGGAEVVDMEEYMKDVIKVED